MKHVIHFLTSQTQMTAKDSAVGVLGGIDAAGATAAQNIANFVINECGLAHTEANLQEFRNLGDEAR